MSILNIDNYQLCLADIFQCDPSNTWGWRGLSSREIMNWAQNSESIDQFIRNLQDWVLSGCKYMSAEITAKYNQKWDILYIKLSICNNPPSVIMAISHYKDKGGDLKYIADRPLVVWQYFNSNWVV